MAKESKKEARKRARAERKQAADEARREVREQAEVVHEEKGEISRAERKALKKRFREQRRERKLARKQGVAEPAADAESATLAERQAMAKLDEIDAIRKRSEERTLSAELDEAEKRLGAEQQRTDQALEEARGRLTEVEAKAAQAEQRAVQAERLTERKVEERERGGGGMRPDQGGAPVASTPAPAPSALSSQLNINSASFDQLRGIGLSVTQAGRILAHREKNKGGFASLDELDDMKGFTPDLVARLKQGLKA